jgi:hypothetical protein
MNKFILSLSVSLCDANTPIIPGHGARGIRTLHRSYASAESK